VNSAIISSELQNAYDRLNRGGIILYPTDTVWGIGCNALDSEAIGRIYTLKRRNDSKSLIILLAEARDIFQYVADPHPDIVHILQSFDRPTTVIYQQALGLPANLVNQDGSIAIRVTKNPFCKSLIKKLSAPLVSTSANISGQPAPSVFSEVSDMIRNGVDYIVNDQVAGPGSGNASRLVRILEDGSLATIRA
jgi:L-threonylcarbamoyladenylate synthase